jgi:hypothetical protein
VSRGSAVDVVTAYGLDDLEVGVRVPAWTEFSLLHIVHTGSGAHPASNQWVPGAKRQGREADHSSPASANIKKMWICTIHSPIRLHYVQLYRYLFVDICIPSVCSD